MARKKINPDISEFYLLLSAPELFDPEETFLFNDELDKDQQEMLEVWANKFNSQFIIRTEDEKIAIVKKEKAKAEYKKQENKERNKRKI
ncbi:MAG: hypothetical protein WC356_03030 [Candidatus Micrarchaeia archaeon]|jgi:hydroxymethylpyrimidine pyrophosphatase-like HAD family hydrolase